MKSNRSMPQSQVIPELAYPDVNTAAQWLARAFGFSIRLLIGSHRAQLEFGDGAVILRAGEAPAAEASTSHSVMVRVDDVDAHYSRAVSTGAKVSGAPTTHPYGERQYAAQDLAGYWWVFSQSVEDIHPSQWGGELLGGLQTGTDEQAIREAHRIWIDAVNAGDLARLLTLITDDVVLFGPGQAPTGRDGFAATFSDAHRRLVIRCLSELQEVVVVGDTAYTVCRDTLSAIPRTDGDTIRLAGHRITVYRKQIDGRWLLARDAHTLSPDETAGS